MPSMVTRDYLSKQMRVHANTYANRLNSNMAWFNFPWPSEHLVKDVRLYIFLRYTCDNNHYTLNDFSGDWGKIFLKRSPKTKGEGISLPANKYMSNKSNYSKNSADYKTESSAGLNSLGPPILGKKNI